MGQEIILKVIGEGMACINNFKNVTPVYYENVEQFLKRSDNFSPGPVLIVNNDLNQWYEMTSNRFPTGHFPVIFVGENTEIGSIRKAYDQGVFEYMIMPANENELLIKIERAQLFVKVQQKETLKSEIETFLNMTKIETLYLNTFFGANERPRKKDIIAFVWGSKQIHNKNFDVHLHNLRKKLSEFHINIERSLSGEYFLQYQIDTVFEIINDKKAQHERRLNKATQTINLTPHQLYTKYAR